MPTSLTCQFKAHLKKQGWEHLSMVVGLSGGLDSMVLATLLKAAGVKIHLAHCNFHLRGEESNEDAAFVRRWAQSEQLPLTVKEFNTPELLREGGNLQDVARLLRYTWFEALRQELGYDLIAVGHHQQDSIETLLVNFFKGTGMRGLHGILPQNGKLIRPLLPFTKEELREWSEIKALNWREDSSNQTDHYLRNRIRQQLWPVIIELFPDAQRALGNNINRFRDIEALYRQQIETYKKKWLKGKGADFYLPLRSLKMNKSVATILYELLKDFGFTSKQMPDALALLDCESGKWLTSKEYRLLRDRENLILTPIKNQEMQGFKIPFPESKTQYELPDAKLQIEAGDFPKERKSRENTKQELVELTPADFPLKLRPLRDGDYFYPLGMGRKKKKVGKFLRDLKVPLHQKPKTWILESQERIIWVLGYRIDERFKLQNKSKSVVRLTLIPKSPLSEK